MRIDLHALSRFLIAAIACAQLAGCSSNGRKPDTQFDLGSPVARAGMHADAPLAALVVTDATGSAALENERMFYRLDYADGMQARSYANSRWSASPLELVTLRLRSRLAQMGTKVLQPTDALTGVPVLRLEVDEFVQSFASAGQSTGQVVLRASVLRDHMLVDQKTFTRSTPATTGDAAGGARALSASVDGIADDLARWLAGLSLAPAR